MLAAARCIDTQLPAVLLHGFPIVGNIQRGRRWPAILTSEGGISVHELSDRAWEFFGKVVRNVKKCEVTEIWAATMEDVEEGDTVGPMFSRDEVSEFLGTDQWIPTQRFEVVEKNKVRGDDSATVNGVNHGHGEDRPAVSTDVNVAALRWLRSHIRRARRSKGESWTKGRHTVRSKSSQIREGGV